jgi:hypothetical protein
MTTRPVKQVEPQSLWLPAERQADLTLASAVRHAME